MNGLNLFDGFQFNDNRVLNKQIQAKPLLRHCLPAIDNRQGYFALYIQSHTSELDHHASAVNTLK